MRLKIQSADSPLVVNLEELAGCYAGVVTIGRKCKEVWNAVAVDDESVDPFQCYLVGTAGGPWKLRHGQNRTECPKGLLSTKTLPCTSCMGRCVGAHPGKARFYQRTPEVPTCLNGAPLSEWGSEIQVGDVITFGNTSIQVME